MFFFSNFFLNYTFFVSFDPLSQFEIFDWIIQLNGWFHQSFNVSINVPFFVEKFFGMNILTIVILLLCLSHIIFSESKNTSFVKPTSFFNFFKTSILELNITIVKNNIALKQQFWFYIALFFFILVFSLNIIGLVPYTYTITSSFAITFFFAFTIFSTINIFGIYRTGFFNFFTIFLPKGTPLNITFLLIIIEIISYVARVFSLSIRLFANMMAGHTLLKTLIGFSFSLILNNFFLAPVAFIPWIIVSIIFLLEILIAFLQAYVFIVLFCIYVNDVIASH